MTLSKLVVPRLNKFTVIATVLEVLEGHIEALQENRKFEGRTAQQVQNGFNKRAEAMGELWFFPSYLQRHAKSGDFFIETNGRFRLRDELLDGVTLKDLVAVRASILSHWEKHRANKQTLLKEFRRATILSKIEIQSRREFIERHIGDESSQIFEIISYAILSVYFKCLGFSLRRFSTTFANDGGMDFICGEGIYQVTISPSKTKVERDLGKLPGTKRVLVAPSFSNKVAALALANENVLQVIESSDLSKHFLAWLCKKDEDRKEAHHLQQVLEVAIGELNRG